MPTREHHRVRIHLPARLRWTTPFGQKIELSETLDVSRGGLLLFTKELHSAGASLWVTFPYDASLPDGQPEVLARVVRSGKAVQAISAANARVAVSKQNAPTQARSGKPGKSARVVQMSPAPATFAVAVHFEEHSHTATNGHRTRHDPERRASPRCTLGVPVRVRPEHVPWFEEAMSLDFSARGMCFRSQREYSLGEPLKIALEDSASTPWSGAREFRARVVRVSPAPNGVALDVSVCRIP
jgi:PilZ domain-containing protein